MNAKIPMSVHPVSTVRILRVHMNVPAHLVIKVLEIIAYVSPSLCIRHNWKYLTEIHTLLSSTYFYYISASCNPPCKPGGRCVKPNLCECPEGLNGSRCEKGEYNNTPLSAHCVLLLVYAFTFVKMWSCFCHRCEWVWSWSWL